MVDNNASIFLSGPIRQDGVVRCCICDPDIQRPHNGVIKGMFGEQEVSEMKYWCTRCGRELSQHDIDLHFPAENWTDSR